VDLREEHESVCIEGCNGDRGCVYVAAQTQPLAVTFGLGSPKFDGEGRTITVELPDVFLVATYTPNSGQRLERCGGGLWWWGCW